MPPATASGHIDLWEYPERAIRLCHRRLSDEPLRGVRRYPHIPQPARVATRRSVVLQRSIPIALICRAIIPSELPWRILRTFALCLQHLALCLALRLGVLLLRFG